MKNYLFLEAQSFPLDLISKKCYIFARDNVYKQKPEDILAPTEGYKTYISKKHKVTTLQWKNNNYKNMYLNNKTTTATT